MPLSPHLAAWLAGFGHDAVHAVTLGLSTASDVEIIAVARREQRTIITADLDYPRLLALARAAEPSLILFRGGNWKDSDIRARLAAILDRIATSEIAGSIIVVEHERIRRRRLPLT